MLTPGRLTHLHSLIFRVGENHTNCWSSSRPQEGNSARAIGTASWTAYWEWIPKILHCSKDLKLFMLNCCPHTPRPGKQQRACCVASRYVMGCPFIWFPSPLLQSSPSSISSWRSFPDAVMWK